MSGDPVLITGVGKRVGHALAQTFLERGSPVIGTYRSERPGLQSLDRMGARLHRCDFDDDAQLDDLIETIVAQHRRLRALIHNASAWLPDEHELSPSEIMRRMMQVHVLAPYRLNLAVSPLLEASTSTHADIVHMGDYVSSRGSRKHIAYAASKAAQDNLTYSFSAKLAPRVKVNSLAPALVLFNEDDDEAYRARALRKSLMGREAGLDEVQHAVDFLLESDYVTGRVIPLDGGRHLV